METMKINLDLSIPKLVKKGSDFVVKPNVEKDILTLLEAKQEIDEALEELRTNLATELRKLSSQATQIQGDVIRCSFSGAKYRVVGENKEFQNISVYQTKKVTPNTKAIEHYRSQTNRLPDGVELVDRKLKIEVKNGKET